MSLRLTAAFEKHDDWIVAYIREIPGVNTQGRTMEEVRRNLDEALTLVMEEYRTQAEKHQPPDALVETYAVLHRKTASS